MSQKEKVCSCSHLYQVQGTLSFEYAVAAFLTEYKSSLPSELTCIFPLDISFRVKTISFLLLIKEMR